MAVKFHLEAWGEPVVSRRLDRFGDRAVRARPAFEALGGTLRGYEKRLFDSEGASGGQPWKALADSTVSQKASAGLDPRILHATTMLRKSLTTKGARGHLSHATHDSLTFGSLIPHGRYHQCGRGVPRRRPVQFTEGQKRYLLKRLQKFIVTGNV